jgi:ribosomal protein L11 methyltransferase
MYFQNLILILPDPEILDHLSDELTEAGALSITLEDAEDKPIFEPLPDEIILWEKMCLSAMFLEEMDLRKLIQKLQKNYPNMVCEIRSIAEKKWETVWAESAVPLCFQNYLWVCSSVCEVPQNDQLILRLDPGLAFGTGTHPTTALCLDWLTAERAYVKNKLVIDYGCGSGILAIAALKLGAKSAYAVDYDPQALQATQDNAKNNEIAPDVLHIQSPTDALPEVDILVANILANPLIELAEYFSSKVKVQGYIVLSGILSSQSAAVKKAYAPYFTELCIVEKEGWVMFVGQYFASGVKKH